MKKLSLNLDALEVDSFAIMREADVEGTVVAHEAGPTRNCYTPDCTATTCI